MFININFIRSFIVIPLILQIFLFSPHDDEKGGLYHREWTKSGPILELRMFDTRYVNICFNHQTKGKK